jgi:hypothetical protein
VVKWGIDSSDHAAVIITITYGLDKGMGMFRPNLAFLNDVELRSLFESKVYLDIEKIDTSWNPPMALELTKTGTY